jgi:hypothetical protein
MHVAAVVEMTVIDIEFADQLILGGVGNVYTEVFRHTGMGGSWRLTVVVTSPNWFLKSRPNIPLAPPSVVSSIRRPARAKVRSLL